jgi:hypothetical protein
MLGVTYVVRGSSDLKTWAPVATNVITADPNLFIDTNHRNFPTDRSCNALDAWIRKSD